MLSTIFCNHYRSMHNNDTCKVGVSYESLKGIAFEKRPCFCKPGKEPNAGCSLMEMPTPEELAETEAYFRKRFEMTNKAREAIVTHLGGAWKRGVAGASGVIDCPVCGVEKSLQFSRAGCNGHIHASCNTQDCVRWME